MVDLVNILTKIAPDLSAQLDIRLKILHEIFKDQPIGRKSLSKHLDMSERSLRTETDLLKKIGLISANQAGMSLTKEGLEIYQELELTLDKGKKGTSLEQAVMANYHIKYVDLVDSKGSVDQVAEALARSVANYLDHQLTDGQHTMTVAGGTTLANIAEHFPENALKGKEFTVVPARGGVGGNMSIQANSIAETIAEKLHGDNMVLYSPEGMSQQTINQLRQEPQISLVLKKMKETDILLFSVGNAKEMSQRRGLSEQERQAIAQKGAVGEVFGCYFNRQGEIVYRVPRLGLQIEDLQHIPYLIAIVADEEKAIALKAFLKIAPNHLVLIADEGLINQVLTG